MRKVNEGMLNIMDPNGTERDNMEGTDSEKLRGISKQDRAYLFSILLSERLNEDLELLELLFLTQKQKSLETYFEELICFCTKHGYVSNRHLPIDSVTKSVTEEYGEVYMESEELLLLGSLPELYRSMKQALCVHKEDEKTGNHNNKYYAVSYGEAIYEFHSCADGNYSVSESSIIASFTTDTQYFFYPVGNTKDYSGNYYVFPTKEKESANPITYKKQ